MRYIVPAVDRPVRSGKKACAEFYPMGAAQNTPAAASRPVAVDAHSVDGMGTQLERWHAALKVHGGVLPHPNSFQWGGAQRAIPALEPIGIAQILFFVGKNLIVNRKCRIDL